MPDLYRHGGQKCDILKPQEFRIVQPARPDCYGTVQEWNAFQDFLLGFLLLHHFHSIEAAVRECRLLLCYTEVKNTQEAFCYGIMDQRWTA